MSNNEGCAVLFLGFLLGCALVLTLMLAVALPDAEEYARGNGMKRGRAIQFCIDHGGQWDDANVRCLKVADTITVQVPK